MEPRRHDIEPRSRDIEPQRGDKERSGILNTPDYRLDINSTFEGVVRLITFILFLFAASLIYYDEPIENFYVALGLFIISAIVCHFTDASYFINNIKCSLDYSSYFLGLGFRYRVCYFDEIDTVAVDSARRKSTARYSLHFNTYYSVVVITNKGRIIPVTDMIESSLLKCNQTASKLAKHFNAKFLPGEEAHSLSAKIDRNDEVKLYLQSR